MRRVGRLHGVGNDTLGIKQIDASSDTDIDYDIRLFDDPKSLHEAIEPRNRGEVLSRVVARYCWE